MNTADDKTLNFLKLEETLLVCSKKHHTCDRCSHLKRCVEWYDENIITGFRSNGRYMLEENDKERLINEFMEFVRI